MRWVEDERVTEQQVEAEEDDYRVLEAGRRCLCCLRSYDFLDRTLPDECAVYSKSNVKEADEADNCCDNSEVRLWVLRNILHWQNNSNSLVGIDCEAETGGPACFAYSGNSRNLSQYRSSLWVTVLHEAHDDDVEERDQDHDVCEDVRLREYFYLPDPT